MAPESFIAVPAARAPRMPKQLLLSPPAGFVLVAVWPPVDCSCWTLWGVLSESALKTCSNWWCLTCQQCIDCCSHVPFALGKLDLLSFKSWLVVVTLLKCH